jgi:hypothetical protein
MNIIYTYSGEQFRILRSPPSYQADDLAIEVPLRLRGRAFRIPITPHPILTPIVSAPTS